MDQFALKVMKQKLRKVEAIVAEPGSVEAIKRQAQLDVLYELLRTYAVRSGSEEDQALVLQEYAAERV